MPHEREPQAKPKNAKEAFGLSEHEMLYYRLSDQRFRELLDDEQATVHTARLDSNSFGEYLFCTISREVAGKRYALTLYGLGYHDQRELWFTDTWVFYENHPFDRLFQQRFSKEEAKEIIQTRRDEIAGYITDNAPSKRALLYAFIADMTDEDGALAEMEDLGSEE